MQYIAGDVGASKIWLSHAIENEQGIATLCYDKKYICADYPHLNAVLEQFYHDAQLHIGDIYRLVLALPAPIQDTQEIVLTNLSWTIHQTPLQQQFQIPHIHFINDLQASAYGLAYIHPDNKITINAGIYKPACNAWVIGLGTGLGVAAKLPSEQIVASEGGHMDYAPTSEIQFALWQWLQKKWSHVSYERVLSGTGLVNIYQFLQLHHRQTCISIDTYHILNQAQQQHPIAVQCVTLFTQICAGFISNLALLLQPHTGIYIVGGLAANISHLLCHHTFLDTYQDKGRMSELVKNIPVYLILDDKIGVYGSLHIASKQYPDTP